MAGIGFELQRVLAKGGLGSVFKVALAGIVIVAGPWLISILGIYSIGTFAGFVLTEGYDLFIAAVVYCYAFSLMLFGGYHYLFSRRVADLVFQRQEAEASSVLFGSLIAVGLLAAVAGSGAAFFLHPRGISSPLLYRASFAILFVTVSLTGLCMLFITLLRWYMGIFLAFAAGMILSFFNVLYFGRRFGLGGALAGFTGGQAAILLALAGMSFFAYPPTGIRTAFRRMLPYFHTYRFLLFAGLFYSAGVWVDKVVFWILRGTEVQGSFFRLYAPYDTAVYFANLTMIPGLVFFIIFSETGFYVALRKYLLRLGSSTLTVMQQEKYGLIRKMNTSLLDQSVFQGSITLGCILLSTDIIGHFLGGSVPTLHFQVVLVAVFFHLLFFTLVTFLFYFEMYRESCLAAALFFTLNLAVSVGVSYAPDAIPGTGYLLGGIAASIYSYTALQNGARKLDRRIFNRL